MPELKKHLYPRIKEMLRQEAPETASRSGVMGGPAANVLQTNEQDRNSILFKNDSMYRHNIARFNFTTYDVRRAQDVINTNTSHNNIMLLANLDDSSDGTNDRHPFLYARVIGIYHTNVIYTGTGMLDYRPRRLEFLWVRWYQLLEGAGTKQGWAANKLDQVRLTPINDDSAFGFVDPSDVLRGCHVVPAFSTGVLHIDGKGLSRCAKDLKDWRRYYVCRYVPCELGHHNAFLIM